MSAGRAFCWHVELVTMWANFWQPQAGACDLFYWCIWRKSTNISNLTQRDDYKIYDDNKLRVVPTNLLVRSKQSFVVSIMSLGRSGRCRWHHGKCGTTETQSTVNNVWCHQQWRLSQSYALGISSLKLIKPTVFAESDRFDSIKPMAFDICPSGLKADHNRCWGKRVVYLWGLFPQVVMLGHTVSYSVYVTHVLVLVVILVLVWKHRPEMYHEWSCPA